MFLIPGIVMHKCVKSMCVKFREAVNFCELKAGNIGSFDQISASSAMLELIGSRGTITLVLTN